jgi:GTP-binding protein Era
LLAACKEGKMNNNEFHSGFIAVIGRPNVGKSTLINTLVGQKVAAVSPRAQTTRRRQLGILTTDNAQAIFVDTPGLHVARHKLGQFLNTEAEEALQGVDTILWIVDVSAEPHDEDKHISSLLNELRKPGTLILGINKIDLVAPETLVARTAAFTALTQPKVVIPFSANRGDGCDVLLQAILDSLPVKEAEFPLDQVTDLYEKEIAADLIREACLMHLRDEVPHGVNVRIDQFTERDNGVAYIHATIFIERESQKGILIGENGAMLKNIGSAARKEIENMSGRKVFLEIRAKVAKDWRDDENQLRQFGYKISKKK